MGIIILKTRTNQESIIDNGISSKKRVCLEEIDAAV